MKFVWKECTIYFGKFLIGSVRYKLAFLEIVNNLTGTKKSVRLSMGNTNRSIRKDKLEMFTARQELEHELSEWINSHTREELGKVIQSQHCARLEQVKTRLLECQQELANMTQEVDSLLEELDTLDLAQYGDDIVNDITVGSSDTPISNDEWLDQLINESESPSPTYIPSVKSLFKHIKTQVGSELAY